MVSYHSPTALALHILCKQGAVKFVFVTSQFKPSLKKKLDVRGKLKVQIAGDVWSLVDNLETSEPSNFSSSD